MTAPLRQALERLRTVVSARLGLRLDDARLVELHEALEDRVDRSAASLEAYLDRLARADGAQELRVIAARATINETYFFRNAGQLAAFAEEILPAVAPGAAARGELRLLSAGCSSGEEPYTLAIIAQERLPALAPGCRLAVVGFDISGPPLERARRARYSDWSLRQTSAEVRARCFRQVGGEHELLPSVRRAVQLEERNLVDDDASFWAPGRFDVIFFRNVAIYLARAAFREVVRRCAASLAPGGFLVLGEAETLRDVSTAFDLRFTHEAFYYRRREGAGGSPSHDRAAAVDVGRSRPVVPAEAVASRPRGAWVAAIGQASQRLERLAEQRSTVVRPEPEARGWDLAGAMDLLRDERFDAAHEALDALPPQASGDPEVELLRAALLVHRGLVVEAELACARLLARDGLNAGAHHLKGLCREHGRDPGAAAELHRSAASLDATFALPHLHLGLLAKRRGAAAEARAAFERALELLPWEDPARLVLFGGGLGREALIGLCRVELRQSGRVSS